jgi:WD40 repeat protein
MMRHAIAVAALLACTLSVRAASTTVATLPMPCKPYYQVISPDGTQVAVWCRDFAAYVLSLPDGKQLRAIAAGQRASTLSYSPDGKWLAVGFHDGSVELYASRGSTPSKRWQAGPRRIDTLHFFPDGKTLVVGPADEAGRVWDLSETPKLLATLPFEFGGINACAVSPDGSVLVVAGDDTALRWYETTTWKKTNENGQFLLESFALAFTPDGKQLLVGGADGRITVLDAVTAKQIRVLPAQAGSYVVAIEMLGSKEAATVYLDDAGDKPPHGLVWDLTSSSSSAFKPDAAPTACVIVNGELWIGTSEGQTLTVSRHQ